ncbi:MAG TPA: MBL fold metallo-hydrolase [Thermomicrobiales bacterium]|nr:MBL fold metallo-hydrolase [Thermomicrobiales bacterium]
MLTKLTDRVYALPGGANIGIVLVDDAHGVLIDSGLNESSGRKALRAAREELGAEITAIVTTHGHADHFGGNQFVVNRTSATVYAPALDEVILRYPILQPALLYGGADPIDAMRTSFMLADASPVDVIYDAGLLNIAGLEAISLAGHSGNQMGILVDGVFFAADVVLPESILEKYRIPYLYSVTDHLVALDACTAVNATCVVPGHGPILDSLFDLRDQNRAIVLETAEAILDVCATPQDTSTIMTAALNARGANVTDAAGFYLLQPTIQAYLTHLTRSGALNHAVTGNRSLWERA